MPEVTESLPRQELRKLRAALAADPLAGRVFLGGSMARGDDDEVSDIDLWIEGEDWEPGRLGDLIVAGRTRLSQDSPFFHGVTSGGVILDIYYRSSPDERYALLDPVSEDAPTMVAPKPFKECTLIEDFWMCALKHHKVLVRGLDPVAILGLQHDRGFLLRAWVYEDTGEDPGAGRLTVHGVSKLAAHFGPDRVELLGLPCRTREELLLVMKCYQAEMRRIFPHCPLEPMVAERFSHL